ncbi:E3 ubiquitin-protein ligase PUB22-like [Cucurbita pepo subsp. pepo]|uniref:E3 ubiquitin-protein ligase PUB22-like n=1 Tax=Cucurbita pepo subsp. pepo TaxID=3664 RepID=UPI000C9D812C|nr:E3 ubiquitin-protein ligase PUB22-like [Cucurbita pepo subsp. pepo]
MEEIEVPNYFLCPISLQIMKDPVTVPSGITYDRPSIETWLFSTKNASCPITKLPIPADSDSLTPNHTLRRLIQAWCTLHSDHGIERFPTPKPPINKPQIHKLISSSSSTPSSLLSCIRRLRSLAAESESNRRCIESAGAPEFLASVIINSISDNDNETASISCHEALSTLHNLRLSDSKLKSLTVNAELFDSLTKVMEQGTYESRAYAALLLKSLLEVADPMELTFLKSELFVEIVGILKDQTSQQSLKAALGILITACTWGRNKVKAVEAGGVVALVEILLSGPERRVSEMVLTAMDLLCGCAEGRAALLGHGGGMAVVSKKILRVSQVGSERAVRILFWVAKYSGSPAVLTEMAQLGIVAKLCLVLQVESGSKTKEKAKEILKMHARVWRNSACIPSKLASSYPAN